MKTQDLVGAIKRAAKFAMEAAPDDAEARCLIFVAHLSGGIDEYEEELADLLDLAFRSGPRVVEGLQ